MGEGDIGDYAAHIRHEADALRARLASARLPAERAALVEMIRLERVAARSDEAAAADVGPELATPGTTLDA